MSDAPRKHRFRYNLRTLMLVVTLLCLWLGWEFNAIQERRAIVEWTVANDGLVYNGGSHIGFFDGSFSTLTFTPASMPFWRRWMGDVAALEITLPASATARDHRRAQRAFPEARVYMFPEFDRVPQLMTGISKGLRGRRPE
jgi:hypothetical protein